MSDHDDFADKVSALAREAEMCGHKEAAAVLYALAGAVLGGPGVERALFRHVAPFTELMFEAVVGNKATDDHEQRRDP